jgi:hypothetical protein
MSSRAKRILAAILIIGFVGIVCAGILWVRPRVLRPNSATQDEELVEKTLGEFRSIAGTNYLIASVTGSESNTNIYDELFSSGRWYGRGYGFSQYNLVFLDAATETVYPLLDTNEYEIVSMDGFPKPVYELNENKPPEQKEPIAWWLFSIIKSDTDQDNDLTSLDKQTLSVADVGGKGYTEIIADVDNLLGTAYKDNDTLLVIYRSNGKNYLAHVDLPSRQVSSTEELPLGEIK